MENINNIFLNELGKDCNIKGGGAAGGLGAGLMAYLNAKMESGFDLVAKQVNLEKALENANLVFTGEGSIDLSTNAGKVPIGVCNYAKKYQIKQVIGITGHCKFKNNNKTIDVIDATNHSNDNETILLPFCIADSPMTLNESMERASELIETTTCKIVQFYNSFSQ